MKSSIIATTLLAAGAIAQTTGQLGDAEVVSGLPIGVTYKATLPDKNTTTLRGTVTGATNSDGTGVLWTVDVSGFPDSSLGPFLYHVHDQPVPANGNCTATLAHLDPYIRGEMPPCDPAAPQTCQVGDLSGKYGKPVGPSYQATFLDLYTSTQQGPASFFGNRSIVFHLANTTRINCANFELVAASPNGSYPSATATPPAPSGTGSAVSPPPAEFTGGAAQMLISGMAVVAGMVAFTL